MQPSKRAASSIVAFCVRPYPIHSGELTLALQVTSLDIIAVFVSPVNSAVTLERSYLNYSHRQRQKSLIIVNVVDLVLKFVLAAVYLLQQQHHVITLNFLPSRHFDS